MIPIDASWPSIVRDLPLVLQAGGESMAITSGRSCRTTSGKSSMLALIGPKATESESLSATRSKPRDFDTSIPSAFIWDGHYYLAGPGRPASWLEESFRGSRPADSGTGRLGEVKRAGCCAISEPARYASAEELAWRWQLPKPKRSTTWFLISRPGRLSAKLSMFRTLNITAPAGWPQASHLSSRDVPITT